MQNVYQKYKNAVIDPKTQQALNQPLPLGKLEKEHAEFLETLVDKLQKGELDTLVPGTLFNRAIYDRLPESEQEKTDLAAINLMGIIRQIEKLWGLEHKTSFQIQNLVETVWQMKSKFEEEHGDVFII